jgi:hypothetical protein
MMATTLTEMDVTLIALSEIITVVQQHLHTKIQLQTLALVPVQLVTIRILRYLILIPVLLATILVAHALLPLHAILVLLQAIES